MKNKKLILTEKKQSAADTLEDILDKIPFFSSSEELKIPSNLLPPLSSRKSDSTIAPETQQLIQKETEKLLSQLFPGFTDRLATTKAKQANRPQRPEGALPIPDDYLDDRRQEQIQLGLGPRGYPAPGREFSKKPRDLYSFEPAAIVQQVQRAIAKQWPLVITKAKQLNRPQRPEGALPIPDDYLDDRRQEQIQLGLGPRGYPAPGREFSKKPRDLYSFEPAAIVQQAITRLQADKTNLPGIYDMFPPEQTPAADQTSRTQRPEGAPQKTEVVSRPEREDGTDYLPGIYDPPEQTLAARPQDGDPDFMGPPSSLKNPPLGPPEMVDGIPVFRPGAFIQQGIPQTNSSQKPAEQTPTDDQTSQAQNSYWSPPNLGYENPLQQNINDRLQWLIDKKIQDYKEIKKKADEALAAAAEKQRQKDYDAAIAEMPKWIAAQLKTGTVLGPQRLEQIYRKNNVAPYLPPQDGDPDFIGPPSSLKPSRSVQPPSGETDPLATPFVPTPVKAKLRPIGINDDGTVFPGPEEINRQAKAEGRQPVYTTTGKVSQDRFGGPADPNWRWDAVRHGGLKGAQAAIDNWNLENRVMVTKDEQRFIMPPTPEYIYVTDPYTNFQKRVLRGSELDPDVIQARQDKERSTPEAQQRTAAAKLKLEDDRKKMNKSVTDEEKRRRKAAAAARAAAASPTQGATVPPADHQPMVSPDYPEFKTESIVYTILNGDYFKAKNNIRKTLNENIFTIINKIMTTLSEEIVNPENKGRMTKQDIQKRDRLADKVDAEPIKGKDKKINAKHRLATYIILKSKGKKD